MDVRYNMLSHWLHQLACVDEFTLELIQADASFRRYFRLHSAEKSYIVMDAPPDKEKCGPFVMIARALQQCGLNVPAVLASDLDQGFLLLTDLGEQQYLQALSPLNARALYTVALDALVLLQRCERVDGLVLPEFTSDFMRQELAWCYEWFFVKHLELQTYTKEMDVFFDLLVQVSANQPYVFMHRDYHSANLMVLPNSQVGILDFQDAFRGPVTYDLVSLLRDCYIAWPQDFVVDMALYYKNSLSLDVSDVEFLRWFDYMGMQRHLKALLTFSRKYHRDGNRHYLRHIPRTINYLIEVGQHYSDTQAFSRFCVDYVLPALHKAELICAP